VYLHTDVWDCSLFQKSLSYEAVPSKYYLGDQINEDEKDVACIGRREVLYFGGET
jgi:hypothetical protein